jgi:hypothetical protein
MNMRAGQWIINVGFIPGTRDDSRYMIFGCDHQVAAKILELLGTTPDHITDDDKFRKHTAPKLLSGGTP